MMRTRSSGAIHPAVPRRIWLILSSSDTFFMTLTGILNKAPSAVPRNFRTLPSASLIGSRTFFFSMSVSVTPKVLPIDSLMEVPMPLTASQSGPFAHSFSCPIWCLNSSTNGWNTPWRGSTTSFFRKVLVASQDSLTVFFSGSQISLTTKSLAGSSTLSTNPLVPFFSSP